MSRIWRHRVRSKSLHIRDIVSEVETITNEKIKTHIVPLRKITTTTHSQLHPQGKA